MSVNRLILQHLVCPYPFSTNYRISRVASSGGRVFALGAKCRGFKSLVALSIISKFQLHICLCSSVGRVGPF